MLTITDYLSILSMGTVAGLAGALLLMSVAALIRKIIISVISG